MSHASTARYRTIALVGALVAIPVVAATQGRDRGPSQPAANPSVGAPRGQLLRTVTQASVAQAVRDARTALLQDPGSSYTITLPAGRFDIGGTQGVTGNASIDLSRIDACPGTLTIAGQGMDRTTIVTDDQLVGIMGRRTSCVTIANLTMSRNKIETTQGKVSAMSRDAVTIDVPAGFPDPTSFLSDQREEFADGREVNRKWLRKFVDTPTGPHIVVDQPQVNWLSASRVPGGANRWRFVLAAGRDMPAFRVGDLIGVKSKSGKDAYRFIEGQRITFRGVRWMMETRGIFHSVDYVTIQDCSIAPPPPINGVRFAMASSSGGPQIGNPMRPMTQGHVVTGNDFRGTGDDALLFAHANGVVQNNHLSDSFALGIRIYESPGLKVGNNITERAPIERMADDVLENQERPATSRRRGIQ